jgi:uncharacterized caspase-like protein
VTDPIVKTNTDQPSALVPVFATRAFVLATVEGIQALRQLAEEWERGSETKANNGVGRILRRRIEEYRQQADLLAGWVRRVRKDCDLEEHEAHV